jgi:hypothetical protein
MADEIKFRNFEIFSEILVSKNLYVTKTIANAQSALIEKDL